MATDDFEYRDTTAARMLRDAIDGKRREGMSLRKLAQELGYKQPVVLSHLATGRVPIPIDRAPDLARVLGVPEKAFLLACLKQRHPGVEWSLLAGADDFSDELALLAGRPLETLPPEHRWVLREVVADPHPARRWLKIPEIAAVEFLRELVPDFAIEGFSARERTALRVVLKENKRMD